MAGTISRTGGISIQGTNTNDSASAGYVGEHVISSITSGTTAAASTSYLALTSISLTAGDWEVYGTGILFSRTATITNNADSEVLVGTTSASNSGTADGYSRFYFQANTGISATGRPLGTITTPAIRFSLSTTTTIYLNTSTTYGAGTAPVWVGTLKARRVR